MRRSLIFTAVMCFALVVIIKIVFILYFMNFNCLNMQHCNCCQTEWILVLFVNDTLGYMQKLYCTKRKLGKIFVAWCLPFALFLYNLPLKLFSKLFWITKAKNAYVVMIYIWQTFNISVIALHWIFHSSVLIFTKILLLLPQTKKTFTQKVQSDLKGYLYITEN